jgi:CRISPR-associated protein (Cas_Cas02710).
MLRFARVDPPQIREYANKLALAVFALSSALLESWIADGIEGNVLFSRIYPLQMGQPGFFLGMMVMVILLLFSAFMAYRLGRKYFSARFRTVRARGQVEPKSHLVFALSSINQKLGKSAQGHDCLIEDTKVLELDPGIVEFDEKMRQLERFKTPIEQFIRGLKPHADCVKQITFVTSETSMAGEPVFRAVLDWFFPQIATIKFSEEKVDFTDVMALKDGYRRIIDREQEKDQLSVDITGGTKPVSVAGALATLGYPGVDLQYVETTPGHDNVKKVISFDVVSQT